MILSGEVYPFCRPIEQFFTYAPWQSSATPATISPSSFSFFCGTVRPLKLVDAMAECDALWQRIVLKPGLARANRRRTHTEYRSDDTSKIDLCRLASEPERQSKLSKFPVDIAVGSNYKI
jgi:hypothetical protein